MLDGRLTMLKATYHIMMHFDAEFPASVLEHPIAVPLNMIRDVVWDLVAISHGENSDRIKRTVEVTLYEAKADRHHEAAAILKRWAKLHQIPHQVLTGNGIV